MRQPLINNPNEIVSFDYASLRARRIIGEIKRPEETDNSNLLDALDLLEYFYEESIVFPFSTLDKVLIDVAGKHGFNLENSINHISIFQAVRYIVILIHKIVIAIPDSQVSEVERIDIDSIREILFEYDVASDMRDFEKLEDLKVLIEELPFIERKVIDIILCQREA
jgi:hypothetical protein